MTIRIDDNARKFIEQKSLSRNLSSPGALRVGVRAGGCNGFSYFFEWSEAVPRPEDFVLDIEQAVLLIDPKSYSLLDGSTLSAEIGMINTGLFWINPKQHGTCGCGKSVTF